MVCPVCNGTRLRVRTDYGSERLYSEQECNGCGGRGYVNEGEREFAVEVFVDQKLVQRIYVLARHAPDALFYAAEMFAEAYGHSVRAEEVITMEVTE
jgi:hypothetical protein